MLSSCEIRCALIVLVCASSSIADTTPTIALPISSPRALNTNASVDAGDDRGPWMETDGAGVWLTAWRSFDCLVADCDDESDPFNIGDDSDILFAISTDVGATWTAPAPLNTNAYDDTGEDGFPKLATDGNGTWIAIWRSTDPLTTVTPPLSIGWDEDILVSRSVDNGLTWSDPRPVNTNAATDYGRDAQDGSASLSYGTHDTWLAMWHTNQADLTVGATTAPAGIVLDPILGRMYWADAGNRNIRGSNLNGTAIFDRVTTGTTCPMGIALDAVNYKLYWADASTATIQRANSVGLVELEDLVHLTDGARTPYALALDLNARKIYWTDAEAGKILRANMADGSDVETLVSGLTRPCGLALDTRYSPKAPTLYWTDLLARKIQTSTLDDVYFHGLACDPAAPADALFVTDVLGNRLFEVDATVPSASAVGGFTLDNIEALAFDSIQGKLFGIDTDTSRLVILNTTTGQTTPIGASHPGRIIAGLAFDPFHPAGIGSLYGVDTETDHLVVISQTTGQVTVIGAVGFADVRGLAFDINAEILYGSDAASGQLIRINTTTGAGTAVGSLGGFEIEGLTHDPISNTLYGSYGGHLLAIDTATGLASELGTIAPTPVVQDIITTYLKAPLAIAVDPNRHKMYWSDIIEKRIIRANLDGTIWETLVADSPSLRVEVPQGLAIDTANEYLYWTDAVADLIGGADVDGFGAAPATRLVALGAPSYLGNDFDIVGSLSMDAGLTWSPPFALHENAAEDAGNDRVYGSPALANDGSGTWIALWRSDSVSLCTNRNGQGACTETLGLGSDLDILVVRSIDNGRTWIDLQPLNANAGYDTGDDDYPHSATDGQGNWVAVWDSNSDIDSAGSSDWDIFYALSHDNGKTWTDPTPLNTDAATDGARNDHLAQVTTDANGTWVAVWRADDLIGGDYDLLISTSADQGQTWSPPELLNTNAATDTGDDHFPSVTVSATGDWLALWRSDENLGGVIGDDYDIFVAGIGVTHCLRLPGDVSGDGVVDGLDVGPFMSVLLDPGSAGEQDFCAADVIMNGTVDMADVGGFVSVLLGS